MPVDKMNKAALVEYVSQLEAAILPFEAFKPHLAAADVQRRGALDIGINADRLRAVIALCDQIHAREACDDATA